MQSGRGAALLLGELFVCPWVPEQLKAVIKNGAARVVDAKAHPHTGALFDSVLSRQLGPSAGRAVGPPVVAAAVGGADPPVSGQVGAYNNSTECRAVCAAGTAKCTEGERVARSRLHAVRASRQARLSKLRLLPDIDEAQRVRTIQRGFGDDTEGAILVCGAGAGQGGARAAARKEGNTPPCMKPFAIRLAVPVHRASSERARRYALGAGGDGGGGKGGGEGGGGGGGGDGGGGLGDGGGGLGGGGGGDGE
eukprot:scaffold45634_cov71-Phaeocystis_antarctica.AAC.1